MCAGLTDRLLQRDLFRAVGCIDRDEFVNPLTRGGREHRRRFVAWENAPVGDPASVWLSQGIFAVGEPASAAETGARQRLYGNAHGVISIALR